MARKLQSALIKLRAGLVYYLLLTCVSDDFGFRMQSTKTFPTRPILPLDPTFHTEAQTVETTTPLFRTWEGLVLHTHAAWHRPTLFPAMSFPMLDLCSTRYSDGRRSDHILRTV